MPYLEDKGKEQDKENCMYFKNIWRSMTCTVGLVMPKWKTG